jgi:hypothetical protein
LSARNGYDMKHSPSLVLILNFGGIRNSAARSASLHYSRPLP